MTKTSPNTKEQQLYAKQDQAHGTPPNCAWCSLGIGHAQTNSSHAVKPTSAQEVAPQQTAPPSQDEAPNTAPVFWVTSVEVLRSAHAPQLDVIRVRGLVTTEGWESVAARAPHQGHPFRRDP